MSDKISNPVVAVFPDRGRAEAALDELRHAGFHKEQLGLAAPGERLHQADDPIGAMEEKAAEGAVVGGITGTAFGALAGALVTAAIPGVGPIIAGGLLAGIVGGGAAGAALGVFAGPFLALGLSKEEAQRYEREFRAGRTIVVVRAGDRAEETLRILRRHEPVCADVAGPLVTVSG